MGCALSWLAIKGKDPDIIRMRLQFEETSKKEEFPESDLTGIQFGEWYIIVGNGDWVVRLYDYSMITPLSNGCRLVFFNIEEHVMFSLAECWENSQLLCQVTHESEKGLNHLEENGNFPPQYKTIRDQLLEKQENEVDVGSLMVDHVIDIPVELAYSLVGYRHDEIVKAENSLFTVLIHNPDLKPKLLGRKFWLGLKEPDPFWYAIAKKKWW